MSSTTSQETADRFDVSYRDNEVADGLPTATPWDIGGPQPAVQQLVAYGALRGNVLDPGTGPGHHAIHYARNGYRATGIDGPAAVERAKRNAEQAGVEVDFQVADATKLDSFEGYFDTVVDSAFYHVFAGNEAVQAEYLAALRQATRPGARLYMFAFSDRTVNGLFSINGLPKAGLPESNFRRLLPEAGWQIRYLGPTSYQAGFTTASLEQHLQRDGGGGDPVVQDRMRAFLERFKVIEPWLDGSLVEIPMWAVHAERAD